MGGLIDWLKIEAKTNVAVLTFEDRSESELGTEKFKTNSPFFIAHTVRTPKIIMDLTSANLFKFGLTYQLQIRIKTRRYPDPGPNSKFEALVALHTSNIKTLCRQILLIHRKA